MNRGLIPPSALMKYQIAEFVLDTARFRISTGDAAVPVEPKVFDLLVYLVAHRDRVVTREELFKEVWDGREVSDATLSNHVKSARKVLGDSGELQSTIQTIRGRGYQFIAPVTEIPNAGDVAAASPPADANRVGKPAPAWRWPMVGVGLIAAALIGWRFLGSQPLARSDAGTPYVVVVPFDVSGDAPEKWRPFADQVTRELILNLRKISGLRVVPTPSAFTFADNKDREHIRRQIPDVQFVLDGVVSISAGNDLRITAELEDLRKGLVVWDKSYEGRTDDTNLFKLQSNIAAAVSQSLKVAILAEERRSLHEFPTDNLQAYEAYVEGQHQVSLFSQESLPRAVALFEKAIALDPKFYDAYIARSDAYRQLFGYFEPPINLLQKVVDSIAEAQQVRPDSAEAWSSLGLTYVMAWRWKDAWIALNKAKRQDPTLAKTELGFALYYSGIGDGAKVREALANADRLDPLDAELADWGNWALFMVGENQAAREWNEKQIRQHPDIGMVYSGGGVAAYIAGDHARAIKLLEQGDRIDGSPLAKILLAQGYGYAGQKEKVLPLLAQAASTGMYVCPYESAVAYLTLGDEDRAMNLFDEAIEARSNCLIFLRVDPRLTHLRKKSHFQLLLTRVGLDDVSVASYER